MLYSSPSLRSGQRSLALSRVTAILFNLLKHRRYTTSLYTDLRPELGLKLGLQLYSEWRLRLLIDVSPRPASISYPSPSRRSFKLQVPSSSSASSSRSCLHLPVGHHLPRRHPHRRCVAQNQTRHVKQAGEDEAPPLQQNLHRD